MQRYRAGLHVFVITIMNWYDSDRWDIFGSTKQVVCIELKVDLIIIGT